MATDQELDYIAQHPGSFDREFFEGHFLGMLDQWRAWAGVDKDGYLVEIETAQGATIDVAYARAALTWGAFFTEAKRLEIVPYKEIVRVTLRARPPNAEPRPIGFTVESA